MKPIILDLCGGSGAWSMPYREAGYDVRLVTLPEQDVLSYEPPAHVHGILAAPPCTEFSRSGAAWWKSKPPERLEQALEVVDRCLEIIRRCDPKWWALENPVGRLRRLRPELGPVQWAFHPCDYGDPWRKQTLLWGKFLIPWLREQHSCSHPSISTISSGHAWYRQETKDFRSITPPGFARAFFESNP